jgi:hypothetical protein
MRQCKRRQGAMGPSLVEIATAHWLNHGQHLAIPEDYDYAGDVDRVLDFYAFIKRLREAPRRSPQLRPEVNPYIEDRGELLPLIARFLRGEVR